MPPKVDKLIGSIISLLVQICEVLFDFLPAVRTIVQETKTRLQLSENGNKSDVEQTRGGAPAASVVTYSLGPDVGIVLDKETGYCLYGRFSLLINSSFPC